MEVTPYRHVWLLVALAVVGLLSAGAMPAVATPAAENGIIAWSRPFLTSDAEIYGVGPNGGTSRQITRNDRQDFSPDWSPDGRMLAFESSTATDIDLYVLSLPDGTETNLTNEPSFADRTPSWSPDGTRIAFARMNPFTLEGAIMVINADGTGLQQLTAANAMNWQPDWSPDGERIIFVSTMDRASSFDVYSIAPDGTGLTRLSNTPNVQEENPDWSPDGSAVAFDGCLGSSYPCVGSANYEVFRINVDGTGLQRLTTQTGVDAHPSWSPDGTEIAFRSDRTGFTQVWKMDADGSNPTQLTFQNFEGGVDPDWQVRPIVTGS